MQLKERSRLNIKRYDGSGAKYIEDFPDIILFLASDVEKLNGLIRKISTFLSVISMLIILRINK